VPIGSRVGRPSRRLLCRSIARAAKILKRGDQRLIQGVESGRLAVSAAGSSRQRKKKKKPSAEQMLAMLWEPARRLAEAVAQVETGGWVGPNAERPLWEGGGAQSPSRDPIGL